MDLTFSSSSSGGYKQEESINLLAATSPHHPTVYLAYALTRISPTSIISAVFLCSIPGATHFLYQTHALPTMLPPSKH
ncbi:hypothetical protein U1Q18_003237 [Sarracenia purpurea var. burkii]